MRLTFLPRLGELMIKEGKGGIVLQIIVIPNAEANSIVGIEPWKKRLKVKIAASPMGGRANRELIKFLSKLFKRDVIIIRGETGREKDILIKNATREEIETVLGLHH